jgi:hypothetical protein
MARQAKGFRSRRDHILALRDTLKKIRVNSCRPDFELRLIFAIRDILLAFP